MRTCIPFLFGKGPINAAPGWGLVSLLGSPAISLGNMEIRNTLSSGEMTPSHSRHGSRVSLLPAEILAISEQIGLEFTPRYTSQLLAKRSDIRLSSQEMRSISEEISREFMVRPTPPVSHSEIALLPVDPNHLHAYWHLDEESIAEKSPQPLLLRIFSMPDNQAPAPDRPGWFDLSIEPGLVQYKVTVPATMDSNYYSAAIGVRTDDYRFTVLANSDTTYIPHTQIRLANKLTRHRPERHFLNDNASGRGQTR